MALALYYMPRSSCIRGKKTHCPEVFAPVILVLLKGQRHQLCRYELQRRSWFTLNWTSLSQSLGKKIGPRRKANVTRCGAYVAEIDLALCLGIGCTSDVKHTLFMLLDWRAFRLKTAVPHVILCITLGEDLVAPRCKGTFRWELRWNVLVPCLMRAGPHYKSQFGKGVLCFQGVLCSPQSWHLFSLLPVVVLGWIDRLSCVSVNVLCRSNTFGFRRFTAVATSAALTPKIQRCLCP